MKITWKAVVIGVMVLMVVWLIWLSRMSGLLRVGWAWIAVVATGAIVLTAVWLIWKSKTTLKAILTSAIVLTVAWFIYFWAVLFPSSNGWSGGIESILLAPFFFLVGASIGAIIGALIELRTNSAAANAQLEILKQLTEDKRKLKRNGR